MDTMMGSMMDPMMGPMKGTTIHPEKSRLERLVKRFAYLILSVAVLALPMGASAQDAPLKVAVLDMAEALFNSERAKEVDAQVKSETAEDEQRARELAQQAQSLQQRLQQDSSVMSDSERRRVNEELEEIGVQYQYLVQRLQKTVQERREQFQQTYAPDLIQAISEVVEEEGYDLVLRAEAALHYRSAYDITARVTEKLNQQQDN